jgi:hypothetical protein
VFSYGKLSTASYTLVFELMATLVLAMAVAAWFTPLPRSLEPIQESCDVPLADSSHGADAHLAECVES